MIGDLAPLATERLSLRPWRAEDAAGLHVLLNDFRVCRDLAAVPFPYGRDLAESWIAHSLTCLADGSAIHLAICGTEAGSEMLVGGVGLHLAVNRRSARLGYWVGHRFWGHGVASEAAGRLARWGLAQLDIERLEAVVATDNPGSIAVLRKIGFRHAGEGRAAFLARGAEQRVLRFDATRADLFDDAAPPAANGAAPLLLVAACALIDGEGRVLLARRPEGKPMAGLWEFPGGKMDPGEIPEAALIRELKEELGIDVAAACLAPFAFASHAYDRFHLLMPLFLCRRWKGTPRPREGQRLAWVAPERLVDYPMPPADRPLVPLLRDFL